VTHETLRLSCPRSSAISAHSSINLASPPYARAAIMLSESINFRWRGAREGGEPRAPALLLPVSVCGLVAPRGSDPLAALAAVHGASRVYDASVKG
jgi:hypothetical protein